MEEKKPIIEKLSPSCPYSSTNLLSYISVSWMNPLFKKGCKRKLAHSDLYPIASCDESNYLTCELEKHWNMEIEDARRKNNHPSFTKAFVLTYYKWFLLYGAVLFFADALFIATPLLIGELSLYLSNPDSIPVSFAYVYAVSIAVTSVFGTIVNQVDNLNMQRYGWNAKTAVVGLMYKKTLKLNHEALSQTTAGKVVNLSSIDAMRYLSAFDLLHYLWLSPLQVFFALYILWGSLGPSALVGISMMFLIMILQAIMGKFLSVLRLKAALVTDQRVNVLNEVLSAMRVIKMYSWEKSFKKTISHLRKVETKKIYQASLLRAGNIVSMYGSGPTLVYVTFVAFVALGGKLSLHIVFIGVGLFSILKVTVGNLFPICIENLSAIVVALKRTEEFLLLPEVEPIACSGCPVEEDVSISIGNFTGSWDEDGKTTLNNISFEVKKGELLIVVGPVSAGKSSILNAILKELPAQSGEVKVRGKVAYCSQIPWLLSDSIRNNIVFHEAFHENRYKNVIKACALGRDLEILPSGDETLVGERGVTLSGGQKARVGLARMAYSLGCEVALFDDPLSAVDPSVANHLFEECICGFMKGKARVLVTHQVQFLEKADRILVMKKGKIIDCGTFQQLLDKGTDLVSLVKTDDDIKKDDGVYRHIADSLATCHSPRASGDVYILESQQHSLSEDDVIKDVDLAFLDSELNHPVKETTGDAAANWWSYYQYFKAGVSACFLVVFVIITVCVHVLLFISNWWLVHWAFEYEQYVCSTNPFNETTTPCSQLHSQSAEMLVNQTQNYQNIFNQTASLLQTSFIEDRTFDEKYYMIMYSVFTIGFVTFFYVQTSMHFYVCIRSSIQLHAGMLAAMLKAKIRFFDTNPVGAVLNRFSKDMGQVDELLPKVFIDIVFLCVSMLAILIYVIVVNYFVIIIVVPMAIYFAWIRRYYVISSKEIKRVEGSSRSPVFSHLSSTLQGLALIRSFKAQDSFIDKHHRLHDHHGAAWSAFMFGSRWFSFRLDMMTSLFVGACAIFSVVLISVLPEDFPVNAGNLGLTLTYSISLLGAFQWAMRQTAEAENLMTSVERIREYHNIPPEANNQRKTEKLPQDWPKNGSISFSDVCFAYFKGGPQVLKNITLHIRGREKLGIVGRTGAGKSSIIAAIFRMSDYVTGKITIDGIDTSQMTLRDLRNSLAIIPQDPILFGSTIRMNLDAFCAHTDDELLSSLEQVQLKSLVENLPLKLETKLNESGTNLSVGQRQLVCLARAILRNNKILIIDEATANVDMRTDQLIQKTIKESFYHCTVLTIAHRLNTIISSDRILVLDNGEVVECDHPHKLLSKPDGGFTQMVKMAGDQEEELRKVAEQAYVKKQSDTPSQRKGSVQ